MIQSLIRVSIVVFLASSIAAHPTLETRNILDEVTRSAPHGRKCEVPGACPGLSDFDDGNAIDRLSPIKKFTAMSATRLDGFTIVRASNIAGKKNKQVEMPHIGGLGGKKVEMVLNDGEWFTEAAFGVSRHISDRIGCFELWTNKGTHQKFGSGLCDQVETAKDGYKISYGLQESLSEICPLMHDRGFFGKYGSEVDQLGLVYTKI